MRNRERGEEYEVEMGLVDEYSKLWMPTETGDPTIVFFWAPVLYWLLLLTDWAIGKKLKDKLGKAWQILKGWFNMLSCGSMVVWALILLMRMVHAGRGVTIREEGDVFLMLGMGVLISILISLFSFHLIRQAPPLPEKESALAIRSILTANDTHELSDIMAYVKNEVRKVRAEMADYFRTPRPEKVGFHPVEVTETPVAKVKPKKTNGDVEMTTAKEMTKGLKACGRCGKTEHKAKDCMYIKLTCYRYGLRGHKATMCPHTAHTDAKGRVVTRIENRPGSIKMFQRRDRTQGDALDTGESVINKLQDQLKIRAKKEKRRRELKHLQKAMLDEGLEAVEEAQPTNGNGGAAASSSLESPSNKRTKTEDKAILTLSRLAELLSLSDSD